MSFFLHALAANDPETQGRILAFQQALEALAWIENRNIQIEHRFAAGNFDLMRAHSAELAALAPDVAVASSSSVIRAIRQATANIPIVFNLVNDPGRAGFCRRFSPSGREHYRLHIHGPSNSWEMAGDAQGDCA